MNHYTRTKIVKALPMNRAEYNAYRSWSMPIVGDGADEGYLVEYTDGGAPNDERHAGYVSWSPKAQFDGAYIDIGDVSGLPAHQQRVVAEKVELEARLKKLTAFFSTAIFEGLDGDEQERLRMQSSVMGEYSDILRDRTRAF